MILRVSSRRFSHNARLSIADAALRLAASGPSMIERSLRRTALRPALLIGAAIAAVAVVLLSIDVGIAPEASMLVGP
jgi:hypothetical protein